MNPILRHLLCLSSLTLTVIVAGCGVGSGSVPVTTATAVSPTVTAFPTVALVPSETPAPPPPQPTVAPVEGISSTQINVRSEPSTAGNVIGMIPPNTKLEIVGTDPAGNWWQIIYPAGVDGRGWVTAQYVTTAGRPDVPVIGGGGVGPDGGNVAIVQQQINVRSGPGTGFNSLGTLNAQDVVGLTGRDASGAWLQIAFPAGGGPDGKGWVNAAFVRATGAENLPIITEAGQVVGTGTPTSIPFTPTPTIIPAWMDNDAQNAPVVSVAFGPSGTRALIYNGEVSAPEGDAQDWIQFIPDQNVVFASLSCRGSGSLEVDFFQNGLPVALEVACNDQMKPLKVHPGSVYLVQLGAPPSTAELQYTSYTLTIRSDP